MDDYSRKYLMDVLKHTTTSLRSFCGALSSTTFQNYTPTFSLC